MCDCVAEMLNHPHAPAHAPAAARSLNLFPIPADHLGTDDDFLPETSDLSHFPAFRAGVTGAGVLLIILCVSCSLTATPASCAPPELETSTRSWSI